MQARLCVTVWFGACALALASGCGARQPAPVRVATPRLPRDIASSDPAIATARALFPSVFGLPQGRRALALGDELRIYIAMDQTFDSLPRPECLNLLGQPALRAGFTQVAYDAGQLPYVAFDVVSPLVFRERRAGYVLAAPSGARGLATFRVASDEDSDPETGSSESEGSSVGFDMEQGFSLNRLVIIEPNGEHTEVAAQITFGPDGLAQVCPESAARRPQECEHRGGGDESEDGNASAGERERAPQQAHNPFPYEYELTRCGPGCEHVCPNGLARLADCSHPPPPVCRGRELDVSLPGVNIGGSCQYESWTLHCAGSCSADRCDAGGPALAFSVPLGLGAEATDAVARLVMSGPSRELVLAGRQLITFDGAGRELSRRTLDRAYDLWPIPTSDGGVILSSSSGRVQKLGGSRPFQTDLDVKPIMYSWALSFGNRLYVVLNTKLFLLDATTGAVERSIDLPRAPNGAPTLGRHGELLMSLGRELLRFEPASRALSRIALPAQSIASPALCSDGRALVATEDGDLLLVAGASVSKLANVGKHVRQNPVCTPDGAALIVTGATVLAGATVLHKLSLANGRELFRLDVQADTEPVVNANGNLFVASAAGIAALASDGTRRYWLDLKGEGDRSRPLLGPNGTLYFTSYNRFSALTHVAPAP